jgi:hypothetical protein
MAATGGAPGRIDTNMKIAVQRAGAIPALTAMLRQGDERCVQAAANALYVLAQAEENRAAMQAAGVVAALREALTRWKCRPPRIAERTKLDCEEALARVMG